MCPLCLIGLHPFVAIGLVGQNWILMFIIDTYHHKPSFLNSNSCRFIVCPDSIKNGVTHEGSWRGLSRNHRNCSFARYILQDLCAHSKWGGTWLGGLWFCLHSQILCMYNVMVARKLNWICCSSCNAGRSMAKDFFKTLRAITTNWFQVIFRLLLKDANWVGASALQGGAGWISSCHLCQPWPSVPLVGSWARKQKNEVSIDD